jgi:hypothetical protein
MSTRWLAGLLALGALAALLALLRAPAGEGEVPRSLADPEPQAQASVAEEPPRRELPARDARPPRAPEASAERGRARGTVVRRSDGSPLPAARVAVLVDGREVASAVADAEGRFDLELLAVPVQADLRAAWQPTTRVLDLGSEFEVALPRAPATASRRLSAEDLARAEPCLLALDTGWILAGSVSDGRGRPVFGARLAASTGNCGDTGLDGGFVLRDLDPDAGEVTLAAAAPGHETRSLQVSGPPDGEERVRVELALPEAGALRGVVVHENGQRAVEVDVALVAQDEVGPGPFRMRTGADGAFAFEGLPEGRFDLVVRVDEAGQRASGVADVAAETWVRGLDSVATAPAEMRVVPARGLALRGTAFDAAGRPLSGHLVVARELRSPPMDPSSWPPAASAEVDPGGRFELRRLQPGAKLLTVEGRPEGCEHDGGVFPAREGAEASPATSRSGPASGSPRPVELARQVDFAGAAAEVALVVNGDAGIPAGKRAPSRIRIAIRGQHWSSSRPELTLVADSATRLVLKLLRQNEYEIPRTGPTSGLIGAQVGGCLPDFRVVHDLRLLGKLDVAPIPAAWITFAVSDAATGEDVQATPIVRLGGGGRAEAVREAHLDHADRRTGHWEATVAVDGYRRARVAGEIPGPAEIMHVDVALERW